jgi:hypothetical protein
VADAFGVTAARLSVGYPLPDYSHPGNYQRQASLVNSVDVMLSVAVATSGMVMSVERQGVLIECETGSRDTQSAP